jgi:hypothetical protein
MDLVQTVQGAHYLKLGTPNAGSNGVRMKRSDLVRMSQYGVAPNRYPEGVISPVATI